MLCSSVCLRARCLLLSVVGLSFLASGCGSNGESESGNITESDVTAAAIGATTGSGDSEWHTR